MHRACTAALCRGGQCRIYRGFATGSAPGAAKFISEGVSELGSGSGAAGAGATEQHHDTAFRFPCGRRKKPFVNFELARSYVRLRGIKSVREWIHYSRTARPAWIPSTPSEYYKGKGFVSYADFCGYSLRVPKRIRKQQCPEALALSRTQARYRISNATSLQGIDLFIAKIKEAAPRIRFKMAPRLSRTTLLYTLDSDESDPEAQHQWATLLVYGTQSAFANLRPRGVPCDAFSKTLAHSSNSKLASESVITFRVKRAACGAGVVGVHVPQSLFFVRDFSECLARGASRQKQAATAPHPAHLTPEKPESPGSTPQSIGSEKKKKHPSRATISFKSSEAVDSPIDLALQLKTWFNHAEKRTLSDWWRDFASPGGAHLLSQICFRVVMKHVYAPLQMCVEAPRHDAWTYNAIVGSGVKVLHRLANPIPSCNGDGCEVYLAKRNTQATGIIPYSTEDPIDALVVYMLRRQRRKPCDVKEDVPLRDSGISGIFVFPRSVLIQYFVNPAIGNRGSLRLGVYHPDAKPRTLQCRLRKTEFDKYFIDFEKFPASPTDQDEGKRRTYHAELEKVRQVFESVNKESQQKNNF
ncbi:unnamed protein product [Amoebophrya sp. A25]|nr:unnamed protein product [Amoebophrya sp. A25]|eukprot:GSA25T00002566001.1